AREKIRADTIADHANDGHHVRRDAEAVEKIPQRIQHPLEPEAQIIRERFSSGRIGGGFFHFRIFVICHFRNHIRNYDLSSPSSSSSNGATSTSRSLPPPCEGPTTSISSS